MIEHPGGASGDRKHLNLEKRAREKDEEDRSRRGGSGSEAEWRAANALYMSVK